jgi:hypothetical protein
VQLRARVDGRQRLLGGVPAVRLDMFTPGSCDGLPRPEMNFVACSSADGGIWYCAYSDFRRSSQARRPLVQFGNVLSIQANTA